MPIGRRGARRPQDEVVPFPLGDTYIRGGNTMIRRVLFTILGAFAALSVGAAGAYFAAQVQVADSVIRAGSVAISTVPTTAPLAIDALAPGTTAVRSLAVINDGSLPSDLVVTASKKAGITEFYDVLAARVSCSGTEVYNGSLSAMRTASLRLAPGAQGDLRFEISLPATATNAVASDYARVSLYVDAEQAH
jgi:hypothetical protein